MTNEYDMTDSLGGLAEIEFPSDAPRDDWLDAIAAAREYIHECDGATKDEIVNELVPEENFPIGHNGVAASAKGFTAGFRDWWWDDIVAPDRENCRISTRQRLRAVCGIQSVGTIPDDVRKQNKCLE